MSSPRYLMAESDSGPKAGAENSPCNTCMCGCDGHAGQDIPPESSVYPHLEVQAAPQTNQLIYGLTDTPPIPLLIVFAAQQTCLAISSPLGTALLVSEAVCAKGEIGLRSQLLSSTMFMIGLSTFTMTTFGVRLPIFQGPAVTYIIPLLTMMSLDEFKCPEKFHAVDPENNSTTLMAVIDNVTVVPNHDVVISRINELAGSLMAAGALHCLVGATGLVGLLARFVGPITIVPTVALFGLYIHSAVASFAETNWTVAVITAAVCILCALYLGRFKTPIPMWTPSRGFHVMWQPFHQVFALSISLIVGWLISYVMTESGALSDDPESKEFKARTDARSGVLDQTPWFVLPYPGQFGLPGFSMSALITFFVATIMSVLDSIGDYNATAQAAHARPPPMYALNRGIAVEGLMSVLGGSLGCGHATCSYGGAIGAIGISKVASRRVFQLVGVLYIFFSFIGKVGAFLITIPHAVIGGTQIITFGIFLGVVLSYLQTTDLNSTRNQSILGMSLLLGLMLPQWLAKNPEAILTGHNDLDNAITILLSNPSLVGGLFACVLDNSVPGTDEERGISQQMQETKEGSKDKRQFYDVGSEVYRLPWIPDAFRKSRIVRWLPMFDTFVEI